MGYMHEDKLTEKNIAGPHCSYSINPASLNAIPVRMDGVDEEYIQNHNNPIRFTSVHSKSQQPHIYHRVHQS